METEQNVDTNESWGVATFREQDEEPLKRRIGRWTRPAPQLRKPQMLDWWPAEAAPQSALQCVADDAFFLWIDWNENRMFFARPAM